MFSETHAYSGFAVDDLEKAGQFYTDTLGIETELLDEQNGLLTLHLAGGRDTLIYRKPGPQPAPYTILNFRVDDIDAVVDGLVERGVEFERYDDFDQDDRGIARGRAQNQGPDIAWFTDPAGNILAVMQD